MPVTKVLAPVLIELFTSQGCSSCPPADQVLSTWAAQEARAGVVLPLAFHVDYWDELGWPDPFAAPEWTRRQRRYAGRLGGGTYTPELVVAGKVGMVGSDLRRIRQETAKAAGRESRLSLTMKEGKIQVAGKPAPGVSPAAAEVYLAIYENGLVTQVKAGENGGQTLKNDFVVRRLVDLGPWTGAEPFERAISPQLEQKWEVSRCGAAVFLQDPASLVISDPAGLFPLGK